MKQGILLTLAGLLPSARRLVVWSAMHMAAPVVTWMMPKQSAWTLPEVAAVWTMWAVMMGAMMLPFAVRRSPFPSPSFTAAPHPRVEARPVLKAAGSWLLTWSRGRSPASLRLLQFTGVLSRMLVISQAWLACALLISAGLYQLTPAKSACLQGCRTPIGFFATVRRQGRFGAFRMGARQGSYCVGCCWALLPQGARTGQALGVMLIAWGLLLPLLR
ncbi:MAG: DUF2182 domain-containing protein [Gammaproteobacteria bacterium]|nr:DUF2182 domain-containing protein [Gammaproteobacteria bacterium]